MAERRLITPIPWYGMPIEDPVGWLRSFENAVKANNWNDTTACRVVGSYCLGNAATWYQRYEAELDTWEKFRAAFLGQYKTEFREEVWRTALKTRRQQPGEQVEQVASEIQTLMERLGDNQPGRERERVQVLIDAFRPEYGAQIRRARPSTSQKAVEIAQNEELILMTSGGAAYDMHHSNGRTSYSQVAGNQYHNGFASGYMPMFSSPWDMPNPVGAHQPPVHLMPTFSNIIMPSPVNEPYVELTERLRKLELNVFQANSSTVKVTTPRTERNDRRDSTAQQPKEKRCHRCQEVGHFARDCPAPRPVRREDATRKETTPMTTQGNAQVQAPTSRSLNTFEILTEEPKGVDVMMAETSRRTRGKTSRQESNREDATPVADLVPSESETLLVEQPAGLQLAQIPLMVNHEPYSITEELTSSQANITIGQLLYHSPSVRRELVGLLKRSNGNINLLDIDLEFETDDDSREVEFAATRAWVSIGGQEVEVLLDTGAAASVINKGLVQKLGLKIELPKAKTLVMADGGTTKTVGTITAVPVMVDSALTPANLLVYEREGDCLILGNDWFKPNRAFPDVDRGELVLRRPEGRVTIPL
ncbi:uncharacterized protein VTP21DRAFT_9665 [Calcarisporiella thermophila]|uniref:uncharacterized protein n=1 Tax=Calcarisporiella thermophila TaxID=911321 RepID=UPI003743BDE4